MQRVSTADVIKVETGRGDSARALPPFFATGESGTFVALNRNKRSIHIDVCGLGMVWSFTVMHQQSVAGFEASVPYLTALVELDEQAMLLLLPKFRPLPAAQ